MKIEELNTKLLNYLVAQIEGFDNGDWLPDYSTDWAAGGPIIEREQITIGADGGGWCAGKPWDEEWMSGFIQRGETPLLAAMRCYCKSCLGDEVDISEELE